MRGFTEFFRQRWREGKENAQNLFAEIKNQGFTGIVSPVRRYVQKWRKRAGQLIKPSFTKCYSLRQTARMLLMKSEEGAKKFLEKLRRLRLKIVGLQDLGIEFRIMIRGNCEELFDGWLKKVQMSEITDRKNCDKFLLTDEKAGRSAMSSEWSNGQTGRAGQTSENDQTADVWTSQFRFVKNQSAATNWKRQN
ncbi:MAG: hypothetical protein ABJA66_20005 [Actinomycetota bacterium]